MSAFTYHATVRMHTACGDAGLCPRCTSAVLRCQCTASSTPAPTQPHPCPRSICTEKYSPPKASNLDVSFMHLTNYAVNKKNEAFVQVSAAKGQHGWNKGMQKHHRKQ